MSDEENTTGTMDILQSVGSVVQVSTKIVYSWACEEAEREEEKQEENDDKNEMEHEEKEEKEWKEHTT